MKEIIKNNAASIMRCMAMKKQKTVLRKVGGEEKLRHTWEKKALDSLPRV